MPRYGMARESCRISAYLVELDVVDPWAANLATPFIALSQTPIQISNQASRKTLLLSLAFLPNPS
jgi:hypothetical protein